MSGNFRVYIRKAIENGKAIFPEKFCVGPDPERKRRDLLELKVSQGAWHFSSQYMNDPVDDDSVEFKRKHFHIVDVVPDKGVDHLFVDPAFSLSKSSDYTAIVLTRMTDENLVYIMEAIRLKQNPREVVKEIFRLNKIYPKIQCNYIESIAAQTMLFENIKEEMLARNHFITMAKYQPSTKENKAQRIRGLLPRYEADGFRFRRGLKDLENELIDFPRGTHDDLIDALSQGIGVWNPPIKINPKKKEWGTFDDWAEMVPKAPMTVMGGAFYDLLPRRR